MCSALLHFKGLKIQNLVKDGPDKPKQIHTLRRTEIENQLNQFGNGY